MPCLHLLVASEAEVAVGFNDLGLLLACEQRDEPLKAPAGSNQRSSQSDRRIVPRRFSQTSLGRNFFRKELSTNPHLKKAVGPLRFIGLDASAFSVAKSKVLALQRSGFKILEFITQWNNGPAGAAAEKKREA